jgi:hypothetical protein
MELRTRNAWAAALLAVTVIALASGRALAQGMDPGELKRITDGSAGVQITDLGELKARMESFSVSTPVTDPGELKALMESFAYQVPQATVLDPGELKGIMEAPARFAVVDPGELKALMESGTKPQATGSESASTGSRGVGWTGIGFVSLVLLLAIGAVAIYRRRYDHIAQA